MNEELKYLIALSQVPDVGPVSARALLKEFGNATNIFQSRKGELLKVNGLGAVRAAAIKNFADWQTVEKEIVFINKNNITYLDLENPEYPQHLKNCTDAPIILYYRGTANLNSPKIISIIGRRLCTDYGRRILDNFIRELAPYNVLIVSGLAIGIDVYAHKQAISNDLNTVGVLAHGLGTMYPSQHQAIANDMEKQGGLLTEYLFETKANKENFPTRNRIVAGMSEATIVVETDIKGGSIITANLANGYNKDVMAFPGNINNQHSAGCNYLIKTNRANLITDAADVAELLNWEPQKTSKKVQRELFLVLSDEEKLILDLLMAKGNLHTDELRNLSQLAPSKFAAITISLEMQGLITMLPAKIYKLID
jgi:DNA processing protein